ncbi:MAG: hypothetical protein JST75_18950 [Bacteroidetes bacterium]|nr:hypothetical protein [Bacteroidota bacterium]
MNKIRVALVISIILSFPTLQYGQKIDSMMSIYADHFPQEKMYLQFDKNVYNPGETIWFKAYLFMGIEPSPISKNFYAELSDGNGNILQRKISPFFESTVAGNFDIPVKYAGNHLHVRAYTSWMLNFDTAFVFEKDIRLLNALKDSAKTNTMSSSSTETYFQFFPEGGDIIAGIENNIAFKANDQYGSPVNVKGVLKDASGKDVLEFNSVHDGMGKFLITPEKDDSLYALWKDEKGIDHRTPFPPIKPDGVSMRIMNTGKKVFFSVSRSADKAEQYDRLTVIAHMNQQLVYKAVVNLKDNFMSGGSIPVDQLPTGVLQITVFANNDLPVAERVVFINNHAYNFSPELIVTTKGVNKRGLNIIDIAVPDTLRTNLSMAITDADVDGKKTNDDNIISRLLLTGDIRGYVHDPNYYFLNAADSTAQFLDLVMLTHGWRRFKWDQVALGKIPVIKYPVEDHLSITAEVLGIDPSRISRDENMNVILQKKDSSVEMMTVPKISRNKFGVTGLVFYDTVRAFYQFNTNRNLSREAAVVINNGLVRGYIKVKPLLVTYTGWTAADSALLRKNKFIAEETARIKENNDKVKTLASVTVRARQKSAAQKLDEEYASGLFSGGDAYVFDLLSDPASGGYPDIFSYLQGKVAGLQITQAGGQTSLTWRGQSPSVYLNEMKVDAAQLTGQSVADIAMVKVFRPGSGMIFGGSGSGAIVIYTKKGEKNKPDPTIKGLEQSRIIGYSVTKQFYAPDYLQKNDFDNDEDIRSTLYWNPLILTGKGSQKVTIQFFNNDISRRLRIVLEGINAEGKITRIEKIIQ